MIQVLSHFLKYLPLVSHPSCFTCLLRVCLGVFQGVFPLAAELVMPSGLCFCHFIMAHFIRSNDNWISLHPNVLTYWPFLSISYTVITEHRNFYVVCFSLDIISRSKCPQAQFKIQIQNHALLHQMPDSNNMKTKICIISHSMIKYTDYHVFIKINAQNLQRDNMKEARIVGSISDVHLCA